MPRDKRPLDELSQAEIDELSDEELMARIEVEPDDRTKAQEYHQEERTRQARIADESFRSTKVTEDYETWRSAPGRYDFEGIDTIPPERKRQRAEDALGTAQDIGLVNNFVEPDTSSDLPGEGNNGFASTRGTFSPGQNDLGVRSDLEGEQREETLAHEVGHAVDYGEWNSAAAAMQGLGLGELEPQIASERMLGEIGGPIDNPDETAEELKERSEERRGPISPGNKEYRESPQELFADFMGDAILKPRNTKAQMQKSREALAETLNDPIAELEPTKEFIDRQLPGGFLPERE
jgi:hypothetical protein